MEKNIKFKLLLITGMWLLVSMIGTISIVPPVRGDGIYTTTEIFPDRDSYTNSSAPDTNYGNAERFYVGAINEMMPVFNCLFHFNFSNKPDSFIKAEIVIPFANVIYPLEYNDLFLTVATCSNNWNESEVTLNNQPAAISLIAEGYSLVIVEQYEFNIIVDVTDHIIGSSGISIIATNPLLNYSLPGYTRESEFPQLGPKLIYTYEPVFPSNPSIFINDDDIYTLESNVSLTLDCDTATEMAFRNGSSGGWSVWEPYATSKMIYLADDEVNRQYTIQVKFKNEEGETDPVKDSIVLVSSIPSNIPSGTIPGYTLVILIISSIAMISIIIRKKCKKRF